MTGLVPCNVIPDEILTDHPDRFRAMLVESGNPVHSLADSHRMREAMRALDLVVVIDVALTETAREADYVLPAASQYEKWECTFFNLEFPRNVFHLRRPLFEPLPGTLPECEIHARLCRALGVYDDDDRRAAAGRRRARPAAFAEAFFALVGARPELGRMAGVLLYETLGPTLTTPDGVPAAGAAAIWGLAHRCALAYRRLDPPGRHRGRRARARRGAVRRDPRQPVGPDVQRRRVRRDDAPPRDRRQEGVAGDPRAARRARRAGERDGGDPAARRVPVRARRRRAALVDRQHDPARPGVAQEGPAGRAAGLGRGRRVARARRRRPGPGHDRRGSAVAVVEVTDTLLAGHVTLPNGFGLGPGGSSDAVGVAPNELTVDRRPRLVRRHAAPQARARPRRARAVAAGAAAD